MQFGLKEGILLLPTANYIKDIHVNRNCMIRHVLSVRISWKCVVAQIKQSDNL